MPHREKLILEFWDRSRQLNAKNNHYRNFAVGFFGLLLSQDMGAGDITAKSIIKKGRKISARIIAKESGVIAGLEEFSLVNSGFKLKFSKKDGDKIKSGDILLEITGNARKILEAERTSLNLLQRMSGIATLTDRLNKKLKNKIKLAATRKTLWGMLDKKAVSIGGGLTHRLDLSDGILIKDNHLKILDNNILKALKSASCKSKYIEIEVENSSQAFEAAESISKIILEKNPKNKSIFAIMLDKIPPEDIKSIIAELKNKKLNNNILFEASGNINENNLTDYIDCGADVVSMGLITNSARILNMSLETK